MAIRKDEIRIRRTIMKRRMFAVAIVLIVVLAMAVFAACGGDEQDYV